MPVLFVTRWFRAGRARVDAARRIPRRCGACRRMLAAAALLLVAAAAPVAAQPVDFGSSDDPGEQLQDVWWRFQNSIDARTGLSLISDHWRAGVGINVHLVSPRMTARLNGIVRGGIYGRYEPDSDELYDVLRLVEFVRFTPRPNSNLYLRAGRVERLRLGTGHLVNFFNSDVAWDERTVGAEGMYTGRAMDVAAFTDNVLINRVVGGRVALRPLFWGGTSQASSLTVGLNYITDLGTRSGSSLGVTAYNVDLSLDALSSGEIRLAPFSSFAWYPAYGSGLAFGADVEADNFIDLARFRLRLALYYNGRKFIPGYVGSFYQVSNPTARILDSQKYLEENHKIDYEAVELADAGGGNDFETELRLLIFERFEFWYYFRRHYGSQSLSEYHMRLFFHQPNRMRINVGMDRGGLLGFFSLFNELGDQTALVFGTDYRVVGPFWAFIHARYTFEKVGEGDDGRDRYLIQRRFEPFTGIRFDF